MIYGTSFKKCYPVKISQFKPNAQRVTANGYSTRTSVKGYFFIATYPAYFACPIWKALDVQNKQKR